MTRTKKKATWQKSANKRKKRKSKANLTSSNEANSTERNSPPNLISDEEHPISDNHLKRGANDSNDSHQEPDKKKAKKIPKSDSENYPAITFSKNFQLQSQIKISDLQSLILYILADGISPKFVSIRHRPQIRKVVVLMIPGLELSMFCASLCQEKCLDTRSPDYYYPKKLSKELLPSNLKLFADMFEYVWPVMTPGDDKCTKMFSPLHAMLTAPLSKSKEESRGVKKKSFTPVKEPHEWRKNPVPITEFLLTSDELIENDYTLHPSLFNTEKEKLIFAESRRSTKTSEEYGWVDTLVTKFENEITLGLDEELTSPTIGWEVLAMDCEMCLTEGSESSLTRISIVGWDGSVVMDELVRPEKPITDYLTQYSGITEKKLENVTTTLADIQKRLVKILHSRTILVGHSLNSDLTALKITHPYIIDTVVLFPHHRGPPLKTSLKWLAQRYLSREIQKGHGILGPGAGHDSIEDAKTCLDLVKLKCEKGKEWGIHELQGESIFKRVARTGIRYKCQASSANQLSENGKSSAAVDWGDPKKGPGAAANFSISCSSDEDVIDGVIRAVSGDIDGKEIPGGGVDFTWGRLRELEALKGWWNNNRHGAIGTTQNLENKSDGMSVYSYLGVKATEPSPSTNPSTSGLDSSEIISQAIADLTQRIYKIYLALPPCTAFLIYSGSGSPIEMSRLQSMQSQFRHEYKFKKWDELSVKWTDVEDQALRRALCAARNGLGFMCIK